MTVKKTGVTLRKGAKVILYCENDDDPKTIQTDIELNFDLDDLHFDSAIRQFYYKKPYPKYGENKIYCIQWNIHLENELPIYE